MTDPERPLTVATDVAWFAARTPTLPPATLTNSYALGGRAVLLVEPATPHEDERRAWLEWARGLVSAGREIVAIFATHHHLDHVGGAEFFARELEVGLWAHPQTASRLPGMHFTRLLDDDEELHLDGPQAQLWRCLHTPGHAPGHLCLLNEAQRVAIVGDMVASVGTIVIDPVDGHLSTYLAQLRRLAELNIDVALPAHGDPITAPRAHFEHYIKHRNAREQKVVAAFDEVGSLATLSELVQHAYKDTPREIWPLAELSLEAHLVKLVEDGHVERHDGAWRRITSPRQPGDS